MIVAFHFLPSSISFSFYVFFLAPSLYVKLYILKISTVNLSIESLILDHFTNVEGQLSEFISAVCKYVSIEDLTNHPSDISHFSFLHVNCRSIRKNFSLLSELIGLMNASPPSAIAVTESWLSEGEDIFFQMPGYNFISVPRSSGRGRRVGIKVNKKFDYNVRLDNRFPSTTYEIVVINIVKKN